MSTPHLSIALPFFLSLACATAPHAPAANERAVSLLSDAVWLDRPNADRNDGTLLADVFRPASARPQPAILVLHPGGWTSGSKRWIRPAARRLAEAGFVAVTLDYRLAPDSRFPAQTEDVAACIRWLRRNAEAFGIARDRIGVFGYSAGAHLAALVGTDPLTGARVQAVAVGGTPADLIDLGPNAMTRALVGGGQETHFEAFVAASPSRRVRGLEPPFLIQHGRFDWMVPARQPRTLRDALRARGVPVEYEESWLGHFAIFLLRDGGVERTLPFFEHWLRDPGALAQTRARAQEAARLEARAEGTGDTQADGPGFAVAQFSTGPSFWQMLGRGGRTGGGGDQAEFFAVMRALGSLAERQPSPSASGEGSRGEGPTANVGRTDGVVGHP